MGISSIGPCPEPPARQQVRLVRSFIPVSPEMLECGTAIQDAINKQLVANMRERAEAELDDFINANRDEIDAFIAQQRTTQ